jgi:hypothetical protein
MKATGKNNSYIIERVLVNQLHKTHIPYLLGIIVKGPKGGRYYLDAFNSELLMKSMFTQECLDDTASGVLSRKSREANIQEYLCIKYDGEKKLNSILAKQYCVAKSAIRKDNSIMKKFIGNIEFFNNNI